MPREYIAPNTLREAVWTGAPAGRALGEITLEVIDTSDDSVVLAEGAASSLLESPGTYRRAYTTPALAGLLLEIWTDHVASVTSTQELEVTYTAAVTPMLFTLEQARALKPLDNVTKYPDEAIIAAGEAASEALEHACSVAFSPRLFQEVSTGTGRYTLPLKVARPLYLTEVTVGGVDVLSSAVLDGGSLYTPGRWTTGREVVVTGYAGYAVTPAHVSRAALLLAKRWLVDSPLNDRMTSHTAPDGTTERFITAGIGSAIFDVPECNSVINEYSLSAGMMVA